MSCQQPQAHPERCGCEQAGVEQVSSAWLAQLRSEYRQYGDECTRLRAENERLERERADQWRLRRDAEADRDTKAAVAAELRAELAALRDQVPALHQYQCRNGEWFNFVSDKHYFDTVEDGTWKIRPLYVAPVVSDKQVALILPPYKTAKDFDGYIGSFNQAAAAIYNSALNHVSALSPLAADVVQVPAELLTRALEGPMDNRMAAAQELRALLATRKADGGDL